jgi:hypothetical protein
MSYGVLKSFLILVIDSMMKGFLELRGEMGRDLVVLVEGSLRYGDKIEWSRVIQMMGF